MICLEHLKIRFEHEYNPHVLLTGIDNISVSVSADKIGSIKKRVGTDIIFQSVKFWLEGKLDANLGPIEAK